MTALLEVSSTAGERRDPPLCVLPVVDVPHMSVRPTELYPGDVLLGYGEPRVVLSWPYPVMVAGTVRARVDTDQGPVTWRMVDAARFEMAKVAHPRVERPEMP